MDAPGRGEPTAEHLLYWFGPFGVSVCDGPYSMFRWQKTNMTRVELTDRRIRGVRQRSRGLFGFLGRPARDGGVEFDIPYAAVTSAGLGPHPARLGLQKVLTIAYREGGEDRVLSLAAYNDPAGQALAVLRRFVPA